MPTAITRRQFLSALVVGATASALPIYTQAQLNSVVCPILMYHYISTAPEDANRTLVDLTVPRELFAQHLDYIVSQGFTAITMRQLWAGISGASELPEKPIVLTFDDGYWDAYAHAVPEMLARGMTGTVFVVSNFMDQPSYLTWGNAQELNAVGIEIGCHTANHYDMSRLGRPLQEAEIVESTQAIEATIGVRPISFCYPFGRQNSITRNILAEQGYATAVTTAHARTHYASNPYRMGRVRIRNSTTVERLGWLIN